MRRTVVVVAVLLACVATPARAATVSISGTAIVFDAAPGEVNEPQGTAGADGRVFLNDAVPLTPGPGCSAVSARGVFCSVPGLSAVGVHLGDGNDRFGGMVIPAGALLSADGGAGDDDVAGDSVDGGPGNDTLRGDPGVNRFNGGPGRDQLLGQGGRDRLSGGSGDDSIQGQGRLSGGSGRDDITTFLGESALRRITSRVYGGSGSDLFATGNGVKDIVDCGKGSDAVRTGRPNGRTDRHRDRFKRSCERRSISP